MDRRLQTGPLVRGRKAPDVDPVSAQNPLAAVGHPQPELKKNEGLFSDSEREIRDAPSAAQSQLPESQPSERQPLLAVRAGPTLTENLQVDMERILRQSLNEHAMLRRVGEVLSIEAPTRRPRPKFGFLARDRGKLNPS